MVSAKADSSGAVRPMMGMGDHRVTMPICTLGVDSPQMKIAMAGADVASCHSESLDPV